MSRPSLLRVAAALLVLSLGHVSPARPQPQTVTPESPSRLTISFTTERIGGGRVLVYGEVRNGNNNACERVVLSVEGLDDGGRVVSRARAYVHGTVPARSSSPFEVRIASPGSERRFRLGIESFQFVSVGN
jgi:hypothetical protein